MIVLIPLSNHILARPYVLLKSIESDSALESGSFAPPLPDTRAICKLVATVRVMCCGGKVSILCDHVSVLLYALPEECMSMNPTIIDRCREHSPVDGCAQARNKSALVLLSFGAGTAFVILVQILFGCRNPSPHSIGPGSDRS